MNDQNVAFDVLFLLLGAILVFAMHGGFAFLELGTVRHKNQVNALVKILVDFSISTIAYFFVGYTVAYGVTFLMPAADLSSGSPSFPLHGLALVRFFFLATFAAAVPAIISGGIAERARFWPQVLAAGIIVGIIYPFAEGIIWGHNFGIQAGLQAVFGAPFHDFSEEEPVIAGHPGHPGRGRFSLGGHVARASRLRRHDEDIATVRSFVAHEPFDDGDLCAVR